MGRKKSFNISYVRVCDDNTSAEIIRNLVRKEINKTLDSQYVVAGNLEEVLAKHITKDMISS